MSDDIHERIESARQLVNRALEALHMGMIAGCPGPHDFVQHRDRREPWCNTCRYTVMGERVPQ